MAGRPARGGSGTLYGMITFIILAVIFLGLFIWQFFFVVNFFHSLFWGKRVGRNPGKANSVEWSAPSPPGHGNFDHQIEVVRGAYEYGSPETDEDNLPQAVPVKG